MNYICEKYKSFKERWLSKTPKEKWSFCHKIGDFALRLIGVRVFSDNKIYFWSYSNLILLASYVSLAMYSIFICIMEDKFEECFKCLCISGQMSSV